MTKLELRTTERLNVGTLLLIAAFELKTGELSTTEVLTIELKSVELRIIKPKTAGNASFTFSAGSGIVKSVGVSRDPKII